MWLNFSYIVPKCVLNSLIRHSPYDFLTNTVFLIQNIHNYFNSSASGEFSKAWGSTKMWSNTNGLGTQVEIIPRAIPVLTSVLHPVSSWSQYWPLYYTRYLLEFSEQYNCEERSTSFVLRWSLGFKLQWWVSLY